MSECTHDCGSCSANCSERKQESLVAQPHKDSHIKKVIGVVSGKGGVGKTTTAVNLGVGLASSGKRVLLVDADPQGSLTVNLGVKNPDELEVSLSSLMQSVIDNEPLAEGAIIRHQEGVDLLPSNIELFGMKQVCSMS